MNQYGMLASFECNSPDAPTMFIGSLLDIGCYNHSPIRKHKSSEHLQHVTSPSTGSHQSSNHGCCMGKGHSLNCQMLIVHTGYTVVVDHTPGRVVQYNCALEIAKTWEQR